jgi:hypothetical protein
MDPDKQLIRIDHIKETAMDTKSTMSNPRRTLIIIFTLITAFVHLYLSLSSKPIDPIFLLNFLGYLALLAAYTLPLPVVKNYHGLVRWVFMAFAAVTIIAYFVVNGFVNIYWFAFPTKLIELALIVLLWFDKN